MTGNERLRSLVCGMLVYIFEHRFKVENLGRVYCNSSRVLVVIYLFCYCIKKAQMSDCSRSCNDKTGGKFSVCTLGRSLAYKIAQIENSASLASFCSTYVFNYIINGAGVQMTKDALL